ncbi:hypothetical protein GCM10022256_24070 [Frondihabitans peucedani]|uniref:Uncharacterized protein n=1 Tax=Frondihabitans peucedani TaxID=598626 RepID=A0ABP8E3H0_9MICO
MLPARGLREIAVPVAPGHAEATHTAISAPRARADARARPRSHFDTPHRPKPLSNCDLGTRGGTHARTATYRRVSDPPAAAGSRHAGTSATSRIAAITTNAKS